MTYRHLISGEAYGVAHEVGDPVGDVPAEKVQEWLTAGLIEPAPVPRVKKTKPREGTNSESQETSDGSTAGFAAS